MKKDFISRDLHNELMSIAFNVIGKQAKLIKKLKKRIAILQVDVRYLESELCVFRSSH